METQEFSPIKLILFDLDGVLVKAKIIHYMALNEALANVDSKFIISSEDHLKKFDGLSTYKKLSMLHEERGLDPALFDLIWEDKQNATMRMFSDLTQDGELIETFKKLKELGYTLGVCSNSIRRSIIVVLSKLGLMEHIDFFLSNEDVKSPKPHPEIYWKGMSMMNRLPCETLIVEDSPTGLLAATRSGANILRVACPEEVTLNRIMNSLNVNEDVPKWKDEKLNVLIPMAGEGSRFAKAGYTFPKPLIDVEGVPMIKKVVDNLNMDANFIFIVRSEHRQKYNLDSSLQLIAPNCKIVEVDKLTEGAACTTLLAKEFIDNDNSLIIANSDQLVEWNSNDFMYKVKETGVDASILSFESIHPKWSYAKVENGYVTEVAEKNPISNIATVGVYYWKHGSDYVKYAEQMIEKDIRVNNEFYVCPVFNEAIEDGKKITTYNVDKMWGIGTPEDLETYLKR